MGKQTNNITNFNPHPRKGSDYFEEVIKYLEKGISIHTPARGVTYTKLSGDDFDYSFQSTPPQGE